MKRFLAPVIVATVVCGGVFGIAAHAGAETPEPPLVVAAAAHSAIAPAAAVDGSPGDDGNAFDQDAFVEKLANSPEVVLGDGSPVQDGDLGLTGPVVAGVFLIREFGPSFAPDVFGSVGTSRPPSDDRLVISLTTDDPAVRNQFLEAARLPAEKVEFVLVHTSAVRGEQLTEQIAQDMPYLKEMGIDVASWGGGADYEYSIGVYDLEDIEVALLHKRYGPVAVVPEVWTEMILF